LCKEIKVSRPTIEALFSDEAESTVIHNKTALALDLPSIRVTPTRISVPGLADETIDRIYFADVYQQKG
jgi:hypothetical protein